MNMIQSIIKSINERSPCSAGGRRATIVGNGSVFVMGPSHLHASLLKAAGYDCIPGVTACGIYELCCWSDDILRILEVYKASRMYLMIPNPVLSTCNKSFADVRDGSFPFVQVKYSGIDRGCSKEVEHLCIQCLEYILQRYSQITLIPWCALARKTFDSTYTTEYGMSYDALIARFGNRVIDIETAIPTPFRELCRDKAGHPSHQGVTALAKLLQS